MILFKEPSVQLILRGEKSQARKLWARARAKEGAEHLLYRRPPMTGEKPFARILVTRVWKQRLGDMTPEEAPNGHAHCAHLLLPSSETIPVIDGELALGTWQSVFLVELDHPRTREVIISVYGS